MFPLKALPKVEVIQAFRRISSTDDESALRHSGANLIKRLARLQHPPARQQQERERFDAINRFAQEVLEDESVVIEIPADQDDILVHRGGIVLPLNSMGTGVHQVIILAAAATTLKETLVCIEEPEIHLHPLLQRKLIRYLAEATTNQYVVATHSAHMLDYERATVIHLRNGTEGTRISQASSPQDVSDICADLGYRPSDLLQANAVIWVEGPSDRIYLRTWIDSLTPNDPVIEGIHYSIMFYGGRLSLAT